MSAIRLNIAIGDSVKFEVAGIPKNMEVVGTFGEASEMALDGMLDNGYRSCPGIIGGG